MTLFRDQKNRKKLLPKKISITFHITEQAITKIRTKDRGDSISEKAKRCYMQTKMTWKLKNTLPRAA